MRVWTAVKRLRVRCAGQDLIEYALLGAFIALLVTAAVPLGAAINAWYDGVAGFAQDGGNSVSAAGSGGSSSASKSHCNGTGSTQSNGKCN